MHPQGNDSTSLCLVFRIYKRALRIVVLASPRAVGKAYEEEGSKVLGTMPGEEETFYQWELCLLLYHQDLIHAGRCFPGTVFQVSLSPSSHGYGGTSHLFPTAGSPRSKSCKPGLESKSASHLFGEVKLTGAGGGRSEVGKEAANKRTHPA